ncbi:MAG TPA: hypothetical protein VNZ22_02270, partial [Bacillota bacterium]|nr:hypothetical protein [Bacillota bacterium]
SPDPGVGYDHVIGVVWNFWKHLENCTNGVPYFLQHQVWKPEHDPRGLGGDQLAMALSSLNLLYGYTGDPDARQMMVRIADYCLDHGFSSPTDAWPNLPFPYNTDLHSGKYDGDMRAGKDFLQPDKAGSFGIELVTLYEMTGTPRYLTAAVNIADTLAAKVTPGDDEHSPWPYRVNARTGEIAAKAYAPYTANWTATLRLFDELLRLKQGNARMYRGTREMLSTWLKTYPMKSNKWGPFFEDITEWSNTEINADTLAWYLLEHPSWDPQWRPNARGILDWTLLTFGTNRWAQYGATAIQEQTVYRVPGNSHTSRHASVELIYCEKTGDTLRKADAIRQLNWATYMVDVDGKNRYPNDDIWLTDGYGDYLRHYLRAMAAVPELAPAGQNHLLRSSSVLQQIQYQGNSIRYRTFDAKARERLRIAFEPAQVTAGGRKLKQVQKAAELEDRDGYYYAASGPVKGLLEIRHSKSGEVEVVGAPAR